MTDDRLLQEILLEQDPTGWRMMVGCILLNRTTRRQVDGVRDDLFEKWPAALDMAAANHPALEDACRPLGLWRRRALTLRKFSQWWVMAREQPYLTDRIRAFDPPGVGDYAAQSWDLFFECVVPRDEITDKVLAGYVERRAGSSGVIW